MVVTYGFGILGYVFEHRSSEDLSNTAADRRDCQMVAIPGYPAPTNAVPRPRPHAR